MAKKSLPWLKGCSIGCGVVVVIIVGLIAGGVFFSRDVLQEFETADRSLDAVAEQFGPIPSYHPEPDGAIRPERIEAFLAARDSIAGVREETERSLLVLAEGEDRSGTFRKIRAGFGLLHQLADFLTRRNEALLEAGLGLGEYYYIYTLAYYSWLELSPADGPPFKLVSENGTILQNIEDLDESVVREFRLEQARASLNRLLLPVLRQQRSDLGDDEGDEELRAWRELLSAEIAALEADAHRIPWEDGLPEIIESSLRPYRDRLEQSYCTMCNALEVGLARK
ncbi:MAG: hypothetical protein GY856_46865 [bacterium]|nr:hypothetical protein [bacterium]